jgi:threonyl-tRNA synthetase
MYDHRKLGRELELFDTDPLIGAGLPYLLPDGAAVRHVLEEYIREAERLAGYQHVYSPVLAKRELYERSGHWAHYRDGMFAPIQVGGEQLVLRPSICPQHALMYAARAHSYRDLPLRLAELGGQFRAELSGVLGGLTRVRAMQLNDAHVFCTIDQVEQEAGAALAMIRQAYRDLGIEAARFRLSLAGPGQKYAGTAEIWERATEILIKVLDEAGLPYDADTGEAAFYGPKIDIQVADSAEREATLSTIQVDFFQPEQFDLEYIGPDGERHRPVMVHRAIIGSLERAMAHLIDVYGGAFPAWLAPLQIVALPVTGAEQSVAEALARRAIEAGLRAEVRPAELGTLASRIRAARLVPYQAVIGPLEAAAGQVAVRLRDGRKLPPLAAQALLDQVLAGVGQRSGELWPAEQRAAG